MSPEFYDSLRKGPTIPSNLLNIERRFMTILKSKKLTVPQKLALYHNLFTIRVNRRHHTLPLEQSTQTEKISSTGSTQTNEEEKDPVIPSQPQSTQTSQVFADDVNDNDAELDASFRPSLTSSVMKRRQPQRSQHSLTPDHSWFHSTIQIKTEMLVEPIHLNSVHLWRTSFQRWPSIRITPISTSTILQR